MAMSDHPLQRIEAPGIVGQSASIGPRQAERDKDQSSKKRQQRRSKRPGIEETLEEEQQTLQAGEANNDNEKTHIDYHA